MSGKQQWGGVMMAAALAALLSLPMAAQTAAAASSEQAATQPAAAAQTETATKKPPLAAPIRQGFWGRINPFARKKYVEGQLSPIRDRVNELDGLTADNAKQISDVDARNTAGIAAANATARKAADTADAAQQAVTADATQANQLNQQVGDVNTKLQGVDQFQVAQTAQLTFKPGPAELGPGAQQQLSSFLQGLSAESGYVVEVTAYSNRTGAAAMAASQDLADAVVRYMVLQQNVPLFRIYTVGLGSAADNGMAAASMSTTRRRRSTSGGTVEIRILKNSLAGTAGASNPS